MKAYKGFDKDLKCRGFQYKVGNTYEMDGDDTKICTKGFHACTNPFDVLNYYGFENNNRFCEVDLDGKTDKENQSDSEICGNRISIKAELGIKGLVNAMVEFSKTWIKDNTKTKTNTRLSSMSDSAQIGSSGNYARIGSSGDSARIDSGGNSARIGSSGDSARIGSSGDFAQIGSSGDFAQIGSSGDSARIDSSGVFAQIGSSGDFAQIGSSGDFAQIGSSGNYEQIGSGGNYAQIVSSGDYAQISSTGEDCVICCAGQNASAKAKKGSWITLSEWQADKKTNRQIPICVKTEYVDGEKIKEDTWYTLKDGEFIEDNKNE